MMAVLKDCLELIPEHYGERIDLAQLPEDEEIYRVLQKADTVGMFQVESRAQMASLPAIIPTASTISSCSSHHPAGADCRPNDASIYEAQAEERARDVSAPVARTGSAAHPGVPLFRSSCCALP